MLDRRLVSAAVQPSRVSLPYLFDDLSLHLCVKMHVAGASSDLHDLMQAREILHMRAVLSIQNETEVFFLLRMSHPESARYAQPRPQRSHSNKVV